MLNPAQQKHLLQIENELEEVCFARQNYTHDNSPKGYAEWVRLWDRGVELGKERDKILAENKP